eukprot:TRINITY_DN27420_c0_g1_i1.p1 TRINITY_DN27420_c0_g1~~TRINITY_DN27420_c0_g1_i1.p1  ORF type:complete len:446 (-),score=39.45 TRINITY_DN27420_c0_g1_i1:382-1644(-)
MMRLAGVVAALFGCVVFCFVPLNFFGVRGNSRPLSGSHAHGEGIDQPLLSGAKDRPPLRRTSDGVDEPAAAHYDEVHPPRHPPHDPWETSSPSLRSSSASGSVRDDGECQLSFFQHANRSGWSAAFGEGSFNENQVVAVGVTHDAISAVVLDGPPSCEAMLFTSDGFTGKHTVIQRMVAAGVKEVRSYSSVSSLVVGKGVSTARTYRPIYKFDSGAASNCFPDWPSVDNDNTCKTSLTHPVPQFYDVVSCGAQDVYTYWLWYGNQNPCFANLGKHGDDWEHVSVYVERSSGRVDKVMYYQHDGWYTRRAGRFDHVGTRPVVFIGKTAHGSYHTWCNGKCSFKDFITKGCLGSVHYCQGGCMYWDDYRNPGPTVDPTLHPLMPGKTIDGITRRGKESFDKSSCKGKGHRSPASAGCWQNDP